MGPLLHCVWSTSDPKEWNPHNDIIIYGLLVCNTDGSEPMCVVCTMCTCRTFLVNIAASTDFVASKQLQKTVHISIRASARMLHYTHYTLCSVHSYIFSTPATRAQCLRMCDPGTKYVKHCIGCIAYIYH